MYDEFLEELAHTIEHHPESVLVMASLNLSSKEKEVVDNPSQENVIFIVHGHDEVNLHRLKKLLKDRFHLECVILSSKPGSGKTLIEKFEREAQSATFAFVLLTPDDTIQKENTKYSQARPNVVFELGWFYGHLGREKVCVLSRKDTSIHSDLAGIVRIEFNEYVNEKLEEIEAELVAGGLLKE